MNHFCTPPPPQKKTKQSKTDLLSKTTEIIFTYNLFSRLVILWVRFVDKTRHQGGEGTRLGIQETG